MGTLASPDHEWIELYNPTVFDINLAGWTLTAADGNPTITISNGIIEAGKYFLLENTNVFSTDVTSSTPYFNYNNTSSLLEDNGETLSLVDTRGDTIDTANGNGGAWPAGILTTSVNHGTMERWGTNADSDSRWYTSNSGWTKHDIAGNLIHGTPGGGNSSTPTPTKTPTATFTPTITRTPTKTGTPTLTPTRTALKTVVISEVGWMGTSSVTSGNEWIELYNTTSEPIDMTGWHLRSFRYNGEDFVLNLDIVLKGTISVRKSDKPSDPSGYYLLETSENAVIFDNPETEPDGQTYSGSLYNSGEILLLCSTLSHCNINTKRQAVDFVNATLSTSGNIMPWPAGSSSTYGSMERKNLTSDEPTSYYTHIGENPRWGRDANGNPVKGTPGHPNWAFTVTSTPRPTTTPTRTPTPLPSAAPILVINEFLARPGADWNNDGVVDVYDEFIEVINAGTVNLNLSGYKLDDEQNLGSAAFTLPSQTLKPGEKAVFYGSQTGILLDDSGDTVRLLRASNNAVLDAVTYTIVKSLDSSVCRYTDGYGSWIVGCFPTPGRPNQLTGDRFPSTSGGQPIPVCVLPDSVPEVFVLAECEESGLGIWNPFYWDASPGEGNAIWQSDERDKWLVGYQ